MAWKKGSLSPAQKKFGTGLANTVGRLVDVKNKRMKR